MGPLQALAIMAMAIDLAESQRVMSMGLRQGRRQTSRLSVRDDVPQQEISDNETVGGYMIDAMIGSPAQSVQLFVDSGSSETWLLSSGAESCTDSCITPYDETSSTSYRSVSGSFSVKYQDESSATGGYIQDAIKLGGVTIEGAKMGLATRTDIDYGILGLGAPMDSKYPQILDLLQDQGIIDSKAYSLDLSSGTIIFGGVDTSRYTGELTLLYPPLGDDPEYYTWSVGLYSLASASASSTKQLMSDPFEKLVLLDSGTELTYLPHDLLDPLYETWNIIPDESSSSAYADCALAGKENETYLEFRFYNHLDENTSDDATEGPVIRVPASDLVIDDVDSSLPSQVTDAFSGDQKICTFGIRSPPSATDGGILGANFLRNAYAVFDVEGAIVGMAPVATGGGDSNIVEITKDGGVEGVKKDDGSGSNGGDDGGNDNFLSILSSWEVTATATTPVTTTTVLSQSGPSEGLLTLVVTMTPSATAEAGAGEEDDDKDNSGQRRWGEQSAAGVTISVACGLMGLGLFLL